MLANVCTLNYIYTRFEALYIWIPLSSTLILFNDVVSENYVNVACTILGVEIAPHA